VAFPRRPEPVRRSFAWEGNHASILLEALTGRTVGCAMSVMMIC
jgi:hypothetical protein